MSGSILDVPPDAERLRAAIGPRADYYLRRWREMDEKGGKVSWNWAACFLNVFWFAYRKMWGPMAAMGLIYVVTTPLMDPTNRTVFKVTVLGLIGLSFLTGGYGNALYRARIERIVADRPSLDGHAAAARGGVSWAAALGALVVLGVLSAIAGMVPALLAHRG
jgi:hypothetical protein